ncbi:MAG: TPR repeat, partial [Porphyrobacter sp. HL-46]
MQATEQPGPDGSSKAGWILLGAALLLAAGSIGYNVYEGSGGSEASEAADAGAPAIADLRAAAEAAGDNAGP